MNQFCSVTMIARTTPGTHNPRNSAQTVTNRLREIVEKNPYTTYVLYAAFLFWPSICCCNVAVCKAQIHFSHRTGNPITGTLANSEACISSGSTLFAKIKTIFRDRNAL